MSMNYLQQRRRAAGICPWCGLKPRTKTSMLCYDCVQKRSAYERKRYQKRKKERAFNFIVTDIASGEELFAGSAPGAAKAAGCHASTVYQYAKEGKMIFGKYFISRKDNIK